MRAVLIVNPNATSTTLTTILQRRYLALHQQLSHRWLVRGVGAWRCSIAVPI